LVHEFRGHTPYLWPEHIDGLSANLFFERPKHLALRDWVARAFAAWLSIVCAAATNRVVGSSAASSAKCRRTPTQAAGLLVTICAILAPFAPSPNYARGLQYALSAIRATLGIETLWPAGRLSVTPGEGVGEGLGKNLVKLTRFRGHRNICVSGAHDGENETTLQP